MKDECLICKAPLEYLNEDLPTLTLEEAEEKQRMGLNEWDPLPDGV